MPKHAAVREQRLARQRRTELQPCRGPVAGRAAVAADHATAVEADRFDEEQPADVGPRVVRSVGAGHGSRVRDEVPSLDDLHDGDRRHVRVQAQRIAGPHLPLGVHTIGVGDPAAGQVLEPLVAVEAALISADRATRPHVAPVRPTHRRASTASALVTACRPATRAAAGPR
jgi:hypothetical protein